MSYSKKILFQLSGSIACYKSCFLLSKLVQNGHEVQVVCTNAALDFIGKGTLEGITGKPVIHSTFQEGHKMDHIHLARWCDLAILCPATAHSINQLAAGLANDIVGAIFLAFDFNKPYWLAPAMNSYMYKHPATQSSLCKLQEWGVRLLEPEEGALACGEIGNGRLMNPETIFMKILGATSLEHPPLKVLISGGGTRESIDGVRFLTNFSSGSTSSCIAELFAQQGHQVSYLHAIDAKVPSVGLGIEKEAFVSSLDLEQKIAARLQNPFDVVIHAAAVSDFTIDAIHTGKNDSFKPSKTIKLSSDEEIKLILKPTYKILNKIRAYSTDKKRFTLIAFKLTINASEENRIAAIQKVLCDPNIDYVVHNDLSEILSDGKTHKSSIHSSAGLLRSCKTKTELAKALEELVTSRSPQQKKDSLSC